MAENQDENSEVASESPQRPRGLNVIHYEGPVIYGFKGDAIYDGSEREFAEMAVTALTARLRREGLEL
jgi:hypothetical protein